MKIKHFYCISAYCLPIAFLALPCLSTAQSPASRTPSTSRTPSKGSAKIAAIKNLVDSGNYVFLAQSAMPARGNIRQLTTDNYTLKINPEKITGDLPYFGRAYTAPTDPSQTGIQFTSKDFDYSITPGKKDGWTVVIKPKDHKDVQQLQLSISSAGYTTLRVISTSREPISFNGIITAPGNP